MEILLKLFRVKQLVELVEMEKILKKDWIKWENDQYWGLKMKIQV